MVNNKAKKGETSGRKKQITNEVVTREYTVNLHKRLHGVYVRHLFFRRELFENFHRLERLKNVHHER